MKNKRLFCLDPLTKNLTIRFYDRYVEESIERGCRIDDFVTFYSKLVLKGLIEYDIQLATLKEGEDDRISALDFLYRLTVSQQSTLAKTKKAELADTITKQVQESGIIYRLEKTKTIIKGEQE